MQCCFAIITFKIFSLEETASLIAKVAKSEHSSGLAIDVPVEVADSVKQQVMDLLELLPLLLHPPQVHLLFTEPKMNYITALTLCHKYSNLQDIINWLVTNGNISTV